MMIKKQLSKFYIKPMADVKAIDIRRAAMDLLARREHSCSELQAKLGRKFITHSSYADNSLDTNTDVDVSANLQELIHQQIAVLTEENLQSDARFVESFINGRKASGKGPLRIRQELEQKNIPSDLLLSYLEDAEHQWHELAIDVYQRKFGSKESTSYQEKAKRLRFMQYRGFSYELLAAVVS